MNRMMFANGGSTGRDRAALFGRGKISAAVLGIAVIGAAACASGGTGWLTPGGVSPCARAFVFVDHGRPAAAIEIPLDAGGPERRAAEILQSSIRKMSGVVLPVRMVGEPGWGNVAAIGFGWEYLPPTLASVRSSLRSDGFLLGTSTGNLYVVSGGGKGAIYGVVHLLEKYYGCRKLSPTAEIFPPRDDLVLGCIFELVNPLNEIRIIDGELARDPDYRDWMRLHSPEDVYGAGAAAAPALPLPDLHVLQADIRLFFDQGVRRYFLRTNAGPGHEFDELRTYLLARLLWNPNLDAKAVMNDFIGGYYGKAGSFIKRYIESLREALDRSGAGLDIYEPPTAHADGYLSAADVAVYNAIFDKAEAAAAGDPPALQRVKTARLPLMYAMLEIAKSDPSGPRGFFVEKGGRRQAKPEMARLLDDFLARCEAAGVRTLDEAGTTPRAYHEALKKFFEANVTR